MRELRRWNVILLSAVVAFKAQASINPELEATPIPVLEASVRVEKLEKEIQSLKSEIRQKTRVFHGLKNGASSPLYAWESEAEVEKKRKKLLPILKIDIKDKLKKLEFFESQLEELQYDLGLNQLGLTTEASKESMDSLSTPMPEFTCFDSPAEPLLDRMVLLQGFGPQQDSASGLKWNSSGWWISHISGPVKNCSAGVVVFDGRIQGRGRVVMVDHGHSIVTLYANLSETTSGPSKSFVRGDKIEAGTVLGTAREKFYFELRKSGTPRDPKTAMRTDHLAKFKETL